MENGIILGNNLLAMAKGKASVRAQREVFGCIPHGAKRCRLRFAGVVFCKRRGISATSSRQAAVARFSMRTQRRTRRDADSREDELKKSV